MTLICVTNTHLLRTCLHQRRGAWSLSVAVYSSSTGKHCQIYVIVPITSVHVHTRSSHVQMLCLFVMRWMRENYVYICCWAAMRRWPICNHHEHQRLTSVCVSRTDQAVPLPPGQQTRCLHICMQN